MTMVYVTQHIEEIGELFEHTMLLRNGYVFDKGCTDDMFTTEKLTAFLGYDLEVRKNDENKRTIRINAEIPMADILRKS